MEGSFFQISSIDVENLVLVCQAPFSFNSKDVENLVLVWQAAFSFSLSFFLQMYTSLSIKMFCE